MYMTIIYEDVKPRAGGAAWAPSQMAESESADRDVAPAKKRLAAIAGYSPRSFRSYAATSVM